MYEHKNDPLLSAETVRHSSTYNILYLPRYVYPES